MPSSDTSDEWVKATGIDGSVEARRLWRWLMGEYPLTGDTAQAVFGFVLRSIPQWLFGDQVDLVESGVEPNIERIREGTAPNSYLEGTLMATIE